MCVMHIMVMRLAVNYGLSAAPTSALFPEAASMMHEEAFKVALREASHARQRRHPQQPLL
jgi:hypothetical protein